MSDHQQPNLEQPEPISDEILALAQDVLQPQGLSHIQETILAMCWQKATYQSISEVSGYDDCYIRAVGAQLWQNLSEKLGQKVTKSNFKVVLKQKLLSINNYSSSNDDVSTVIGLEPPHGQVPLGSLLYVERPPIESDCYKSISQPGALIRIRSAKTTGKTSLMARIIDFARTQNYIAVTVNLELASTDILSDGNCFFRWFCRLVEKALSLPTQLDDYWENCCGSSYNCTEYFEGYLLAVLESPVVLALDNVDVIFNYPDLAVDFFGMLRAWYESARYGNTTSSIWQKLRLVVVYSTNVYIRLPTHQSPFNVGLFVELPDFTVDQIADLAVRYQLNWPQQDIHNLVHLISGNPYLVRLTLYHAKQSSLSLQDIWEKAIMPNSIYTAHLQKKFWTLQSYEALLAGIKQVMTTTEPQSLDPLTLLKLEGMGLIRISHGKASPTCELYCRYFKHLFA